MLLRGILAGVIGTAFMNLSSETEMHLRGRAPSTTPGSATNKLLRVVGVPVLEGPPLQVLSTWTHYFYGAAWGVLLWTLFEPAGLPVAATLPLFLLAVWLTEQVELPALGLTPPSWKWGLREIAIDLWHHVAYAAGAVGGWVLIGVAR